MYKISPFLSTQELLSFYHATLSSTLIYGCQIWGLTAHSTIKKLEVLQNSAIRTIARNDNSFNDVNILTHVTPLYKAFKIIKFRDYITLKNTLLAYDFLNNNLPISFDNFFSPQNSKSSMTTRNSSKGSLYLTHINTSKYGKNSIHHKATISWTNLISIFTKINLRTMNRIGMKALIKKSILDTY